MIDQIIKSNADPIRLPKGSMPQLRDYLLENKIHLIFANAFSSRLGPGSLDMMNEVNRAVAGTKIQKLYLVPNHADVNWIKKRTESIIENGIYQIIEKQGISYHILARGGMDSKEINAREGIYKFFKEASKFAIIGIYEWAVAAKTHYEQVISPKAKRGSHHHKEYHLDSYYIFNKPTNFVQF